MPKINASIMNTIGKFLDKVREEGIHIESAYLFGSYARGKQNKWSDIDIAVVSADIKDDNLEEMIRLTKIAYKIDTRIEPVPFRPDAFVDEDPLVWEIKKEGMALTV